MKNLYDFVMELHSEHGIGTDKDVFIHSFMSESFAIYSTHEAFADNEFIGCFKMNYRIDHENRKIELLFEEI